MATPTITSITPDEGLSRGGYVLTIRGTNFALPPAPAATGYIGGAAPVSVSVTIGGIACPWAEAASPVLILARAPEYRGTATIPVSLDVRVANLRADGTEVTGEHVVEEDGFTFARPGLAAEGYLMRVIRALLEQLARHVVPTVAVTFSRDYDDDPETSERMRDLAPSLHLVGPRMEINRLYTPADGDWQTDPEGLFPGRAVRAPVVADLRFTARAWAVGAYHLHNMAQAFVLTFRDLPWITLQIDPAHPERGDVRYEVEIDWAGLPDLATAPNAGDLYSFEAGVLIRGVQIDDESATVTLRGWNSDDVLTTIEAIPRTI
jgi:hypothetical protein